MTDISSYFESQFYLIYFQELPNWTTLLKVYFFTINLQILDIKIKKKLLAIHNIMM